MKFDAIIFDMDGVLVNTLPYVMQSLEVGLKKYGIKLSQDEANHVLGTSFRDLAVEWNKGRKPEEKIDPTKLSRECGDIEFNLLKKELKPNTVLIDLLKQAKTRHLKLAVATSSQAWRAIQLLKTAGLFDYFDQIVTADEVTKHKPHPEIFLKVAEKLRVDPKRCIVFEDHINGIRAAKSAGMKTIALVTDFNSAKEFDGVADLIIKNFRDVSIPKLEHLFADKNRPGSG